MKFFRCFKHDVRRGIIGEWIYFLPVIGLTFLFCLNFYLRAGNVYPEKLDNLCFEDYFIFIFGGMKEYVPSPDEPFLFPAIWSIAVGYASFITLRYPFDGLETYGQQFLMRAGKRSRWWLSKCLWIFLKTLIYYALIGLCILAACLMFGGHIAGNADGAFIEDVFVIEKELKPAAENHLLLFTAPLMLSLTLNFVQMVLSLYVGQAFALCAVLIYLVSSVYYASPFLIGNSGLLVRSGLLVKDGFPADTALYIQGAVILLAVTAGLFLFQRKDILKKGD